MPGGCSLRKLLPQPCNRLWDAWTPQVERWQRYWRDNEDKQASSQHSPALGWSLLCSEKKILGIPSPFNYFQKFGSPSSSHRLPENLQSPCWLHISQGLGIMGLFPKPGLNLHGGVRGFWKLATSMLSQYLSAQSIWSWDGVAYIPQGPEWEILHFWQALVMPTLLFLWFFVFLHFLPRKMHRNQKTLALPLCMHGRPVFLWSKERPPPRSPIEKRDQSPRDRK